MGVATSGGEGRAAMTHEFVTRRLPAATPTLSAGVPPAPRGTLYTLSAHGGLAVTPRRFTLLFGRGETEDDVHVLVGVDDRRVSRVHGRITGDGREWWLRNTGRLPIRTLAGTQLLEGQELRLDEGYHPLWIGTRGDRQHLLEVVVVGPHQPSGRADFGTGTETPRTYHLDDDERLVLTALAQRYLRGVEPRQPVPWKQVVADLNRRPEGRVWTEKTVANVVGRVRVRLSQPPHKRPEDRDLPAIPGLLMERDRADQPLGNTINETLIDALVGTATLRPEHLELLPPEA
jgi:hypothetical protein